MLNNVVNLNLKISNYGNRVLGVVKEKYGFKDKSHALEKILDIYGDDFVEKEVKDEFLKEVIDDVEKMKKEKRKASASFDELDRLCGLK